MFDMTCFKKPFILKQFSWRDFIHLFRLDIHLLEICFYGNQTPVFSPCPGVRSVLFKSDVCNITVTQNPKVNPLQEGSNRME